MRGTLKCIKLIKTNVMSSISSIQSAMLQKKSMNSYSQERRKSLLHVNTFISISTFKSLTINYHINETMSRTQSCRRNTYINHITVFNLKGHETLFACQHPKQYIYYSHGDSNHSNLEYKYCCVEMEFIHG